MIPLGLSTSNLRLPERLLESDFADITMSPAGSSTSSANLYRWVTSVIAWLAFPLSTILLELNVGGRGVPLGIAIATCGCLWNTHILSLTHSSTLYSLDSLEMVRFSMLGFGIGGNGGLDERQRLAAWV